MSPSGLVLNMWSSEGLSPGLDSQELHCGFVRSVSQTDSWYTPYWSCTNCNKRQRIQVHFHLSVQLKQEHRPYKHSSRSQKPSIFLDLCSELWSAFSFLRSILPALHISHTTILGECICFLSFPVKESLSHRKVVKESFWFAFSVN